MKNDRQKRTQKPDSLTVADFAEKLRSAGLRPTRQRVGIAALLFDGRHRHVTADSLTEEITASGLKVAGGTVYNTLNQFTDAGLLRRVMVHNEHSLFDTNTDHHHHFYDESNDQLVDIPSDDITLTKMPQAPDGHEIKAVHVIVHIQSK